jgi:hypothetical protein
MRVAVVKAAHDDDAGLRCVEHSDAAGLHVEGDTFERFCRNIGNAVVDLVEGETDGGGEIHVEIIARLRSRPRRGVKDFGKAVRDKLSERVAPFCVAARVTLTKIRTAPYGLCQATETSKDDSQGR